MVYLRLKRRRSQIALLGLAHPENDMLVLMNNKPTSEVFHSLAEHMKTGGIKF